MSGDDVDFRELIDEVKGSREDTRHTSEGVDRLTVAMSRSRAFQVVLGVVSVLVVACMVFVVVGILQQRAQSRVLAEQGRVLAEQARCQAIFAAATADRTGALAPLSQMRTDAQNDRSNAEAALILIFLPDGPVTKAQQQRAFHQALLDFKAAQQRYAKADDDYQNASAEHPPPPPPAQTCGS